jgi:hypothetical protein
MTHWADNYATVARIRVRTISTTVMDEVGHQDQGAQDQQLGLVRRQPHQEQHGGGGGDGAVAAPGRDRFDLSLHHLLYFCGLFEFAHC